MVSDFVDPDPILKAPSTAKPTTTKPPPHGNTVISCPTEHGGNGKTKGKNSAKIPETESKAGQTIIFPMTSAMTTKKSPAPQSMKASNDSFQDSLFMKSEQLAVISGSTGEVGYG